jgi:hypothetical protein
MTFFALVEFSFFSLSTLRVFALDVRCTPEDARRYATLLARQHGVSVVAAAVGHKEVITPTRRHGNSFLSVKVGIA